MRVLYERCAAIDVGKDEIVVAVRLPGGDPDGRRTVLKPFTTFYGVLEHVAWWLREQGVTHVAMESTGVYSMPVYHALLAQGGFEKVLVCNATHVRNVPGRKTDFCDAQWLAHLLECGLLKGSFMPPAQVKAVRDLTRYRTKATQARTAEFQRLGDVLQDAGVKIDSVASSLATKSARGMIEALIDGERRAGVLADLAKGKMRAKIADLEQAVTGRFDDHHASLCRWHLRTLDHYDELIADLDISIEQLMRPFRIQRDLLITVPGIGARNVATILAEIGTDPAEVFGDAQHFASWLGLCPGNHASAGKRGPGTRRHGNKHAQAQLVEAAWVAVRSPGYLRSFYRSCVRRFGGWRSPAAKKKAIVAVAHKLAVIIWHVLAAGQPYHDLGEDYFISRADPAKETERLVARLQAQGYQVALTPAA
jgi:transposase